MWPFNKHNCLTDGHALHTQQRKGYYSRGRYDKDEFGRSHFRCMVHYAEQEHEACRYCSHAEQWHETYGYCIQEFSCGPDMVRALDQGKFV